VHVTLKVLDDVPSLRRGHCYKALHAAFAAGRCRFGFRLVHYSVQGNHMHLVCEAADATALSRGMQGLSIRLARRLNRRLGRRGRLFAERYHARILRTPREVRNVLAYVLNNARRHAPADVTFPRDWIDALSSAPYFDGWRNQPRLYSAPEPDTPVTAPVTWLLRTGWRRRGLLHTAEVPGTLG